MLLLLPLCADGAGGACQEQSQACMLLLAHVLALVGGILAVLRTGPLHVLQSMLQTAQLFLGNEGHVKPDSGITSMPLP